MIRVKDIVLHTLSGLYYRCENQKHEKWMNMNPYYVKTEEIIVETYFKKH